MSILDPIIGTPSSPPPSNPPPQGSGESESSGSAPVDEASGSAGSGDANGSGGGAAGQESSPDRLELRPPKASSANPEALVIARAQSAAEAAAAESAAREAAIAAQSAPPATPFGDAEPDPIVSLIRPLETLAEGAGNRDRFLSALYVSADEPAAAETAAKPPAVNLLEDPAYRQQQQAAAEAPRDRVDFRA